MLPRSRARIERLAEGVLARLEPERLSSPGATRVLDALDWYLPAHWGFTSDVVTSLPRGIEALTDFEARRILVAADVYARAEAGDGGARFTLMHELGHVVTVGAEMAVRLQLERRTGLSTQTLATRARVPAFEDPEWQADAFADAALMPRRPFAHAFRRAEPTRRDVELARAFGTSVEVARRRGRTLAAKGWLQETRTRGPAAR